jgi:hypothetical protein
MKRYMTRDDGLSIRSRNLKDLFDSGLDSVEQLNSIRKFLEGAQADDDLVVFYVGHGGFLRNREQDFYLGIKTTVASAELATALRFDALADLLKRCPARVYLILDCCFAAEAVRHLQGDLYSVRVREVMPPRGIAVLAAASRHKAAVSPLGHDYTMFSECLFAAIGEDAPHKKWISLRELSATIDRGIASRYPEEGVRPEVHSPYQPLGDIADLKVFPLVRSEGKGAGLVMASAAASNANVVSAPPQPAISTPVPESVRPQKLWALAAATAGMGVSMTMAWALASRAPSHDLAAAVPAASASHDAVHGSAPQPKSTSSDTNEVLAGIAIPSAPATAPSQAEAPGSKRFVDDVKQARAFDEHEANKQLASLKAKLAGCGASQAAAGEVSVQFLPSGHVTDVRVRPPSLEKQSGACIRPLASGIQVPAFDGVPRKRTVMFRLEATPSTASPATSKGEGDVRSSSAASSPICKCAPLDLTCFLHCNGNESPPGTH